MIKWDLLTEQDWMTIRREKMFGLRFLPDKLRPSPGNSLKAGAADIKMLR